MEFIIAGGKVVERSSLKAEEIFFGRGIHLYQEVWYGYGGIPLLPENLRLLKAQSEIMGIPFPAEFQNQRELFRLIKRMLNKNKCYRSGHVLLQIFSFEGSVGTLITSTAFTGFTFPFGEEGVLAAFSSSKKYTFNKLNRWQFFNEKLWQAAVAEFSGSAVQQPIITNERNSICETAGSNFFLIAEHELKTPAWESGCHENAIRPLVMQAAVQLGLQISEPRFISADEVFEADEIFCASERSGVLWIMGVERQRYIHYYSEKIAEELNVLLKSKAVSHPL